MHAYESQQESVHTNLKRRVKDDCLCNMTYSVSYHNTHTHTHTHTNIPPPPPPHTHTMYI